MGNSFIKERLDRGIAYKDWVLHFQRARVVHLLKEESDHIPLLLNTNEMEVVSRRPFRYIQAWSTDSTSVEVVEKAWQR